ncbi:copper amine oxidase N-terminal domain-containing protein [Paenibacillus sp. JSM ZJ436]|uniref:copper amine oxidase N-terminal domain-containing protein n=1 Tax=Paenibacillus sp. JSM ZJ436 TaxID=3376190 RepID=UPI0037B02983
MKLKKVLGTCMAAVLLVPSMAMAAPAPSASVASVTPTIKTPAADLRMTFSELLAAHFEYQVMTTLKEYQNAEDADLAQDMLEANAEEMVKAVMSLYGAEGAKQFEEIFSSQYEDSAGLGMAVRNKNMNEEKRVKDEMLQDFPSELGSFLSTATGGNLPAGTATQVLMAHEKDVQDVFYNYINGNYEEAYQAYDEGYKRMFIIGEALSSAIVKQMPEKFDHTKVDTPAADLRATFSQLLGAHFNYQVFTSLKQYQQAADAGVAADMLEANANEMVPAIQSLYGKAGADQFAKIFSSQYKDSTSIGEAIRSGNMNDIQEAQDNVLKDFPMELGGFLAAATENNLPAATATKVLMAHEQDVINVVNNFKNKQYAQAYQAFEEGHGRMFDIGAALSGAIVTQMPEKFGGTVTPEPMGPMKIWLGINDHVIKVDDKQIKMDVTPFVEKGTTYVPLRFLSEAIQADVSWNNKTKTAWVMIGEDKAAFWPGVDYVELNTQKLNIGKDVMIRDGRVQVPLRFMAELLDWKVSYDKDTHAITLTK